MVAYLALSVLSNVSNLTACMSLTQKLKNKGWHEVGNWRVAGPAGLYSDGKSFDVSTGRYSVIDASAVGVHYCYAMLRIDGADKGKLFRLSLNLNNALDDNNGFHAVRGNKDSKNFGSSNVAGTVMLKKGDKMSVYVYAENDSKWSIATESGWGCHKLGTNIGFHASGSKDVKFKNAYSRMIGWRTKGNNELYNHGGPGIDAAGYYKVPADGYYVCATQVRINNAHSVGYFRLLLSINGAIDANTGFAVMDGNQGSDNYRSLRVAGLVPLKAGETVSVIVYSQNDLDWTFSKESGFSCNKIFSKSPCAACNIPFSNKVAGPGCACKAGYTGKITWKDNKPSGVCKPVACTVKNSNNKAGPDCACGDGYEGKITWKDNKPTGKCAVAQCDVKNSNKKPGKECKCEKPYVGTIRWMGSTAIGPCGACGTNSGFNADLAKDKKGARSWQELGGWRVNSNTHLYEGNGEFDSSKGRFAPKSDGYYLCNANVGFEYLSSAGLSRLLIAVNKVGVKTPLKDINNGLGAVEGNGGSTTYRSMAVAGVLQIKDGWFASVFVYSSFDSIFTIKSESGFSCHKFRTKFGFHADKLNTETLSMKTGWVRISNWRDSGSLGLYNTGGGFDRKTGFYTAPASGAYFCSALLRLDYASRTSMFVLSLNVDDKPEIDHGLSSVRGNRGSSNYGTMGIAGTIYLKQKQDISLYAYSSNDNFFRVTTEAGWGCHMLGTGVGFHADMSATQTFTQGDGWTRLSKWRTAGNNELYAQGASLNAEGFFLAPESGYYLCAAQVRVDSTYSNARYRMIIAINNEMDINNGLHVTDSNIGYTNYRSLRLAGSVYLKKGDTTNVAIQAPAAEKTWKVHSASGFSCHMFTTKQPCNDGGPKKTTPKPKPTDAPKKTTIPEKTEPPQTKPPIADGSRPLPPRPIADGGISIGGR